MSCDVGCLRGCDALDRGLIVGHPSTSLRLVVGESMCPAKACVPLGFCIGILTKKKKVLDFRIENKHNLVGKHTIIRYLIHTTA
jgi:hypothetical protein